MRLVKFNKNRLVAVNQTFKKLFHNDISTQSSVNVRGGRSADIDVGRPERLLNTDYILVNPGGFIKREII
ncbi:MAG: hypothetical protein Sw2LagTSB_22700 [Shewanella algae]